MRYLRAQIAGAKRLHRLHNGSDAARDIADHISADGNADDNRGADDGREHHERGKVIVGCILGRLVGARVVEINVLLEDIVGFDPDLVDRLAVQLVRFMRRLAGGFP